MATTTRPDGNRAPRKRARKTMRRYAGPRPLVRQAASDLERGLEDTDCRGRDKPGKTHCK
jgi:hypothetical protein